MLDAVTLDQLRMLVAIADAGSFTAAARRVQRAQSAVSHAIGTLESHLGVALFDRSAKTPRLTEIGQAVVADARLTLARMDGLKARARGLAQGIEPELSVAVSVLCPLVPLLAVLDRFAAEFPRVGLGLFIEEIGGAGVLVEERRAILGIVGTPSIQRVDPAAFVTFPMGAVDIVAVAAPGHPLARIGRALSEPDLAEHRQLVPVGRSRSTYAHTLVRDVWRVTDPALRRLMILRGQGWGTLPLPLVAEDLAAGRLVRLDLAVRAEELMRIGLFAIHRADTPLGPAARWLLQAFRAMD